MQENKKFYVVNRSDMSLTVTMDYPFTNKTFEGYGKGHTFTFEALKSLVNTRGGRIALKEYLQIIGQKDEVEEILNELGIQVEEEYFYDSKVVKYLLKEGSLEQLEDTLNFAPSGVIDLIKTLAIKLRIPDKNKIDLISKKTGCNIDMMTSIDIEQESIRKENQVDEPKKKGRKASPVKLDNLEENKTEKKKTTSSRKTSSKNLMDEANNSSETNEL